MSFHLVEFYVTLGLPVLNDCEGEFSLGVLDVGLWNRRP